MAALVAGFPVVGGNLGQSCRGSPHPPMAGHPPWRSTSPCSWVTGALHGFCPPSSSPWSSALPSPRRVPPALSTLYSQQIPNPTSVHPCPRAQSRLGACGALCSSYISRSSHGCRPHVIPFLAKFSLDNHCQARVGNSCMLSSSSAGSSAFAFEPHNNERWLPYCADPCLPLLHHSWQSCSSYGHSRPLCSLKPAPSPALLHGVLSSPIRGQHHPLPPLRLKHAQLPCSSSPVRQQACSSSRDPSSRSHVDSLRVEPSACSTYCSSSPDATPRPLVRLFAVLAAGSSLVLARREQSRRRSAKPLLDAKILW
jgi:hypothetical protein